MLKSRLVVAGAIALLAINPGCGQKLTPITAIFMLDTSASSAKYRGEAAWSIMAITEQLQRSIDRVALYRVNNRVHNLYTGDPVRRGLKSVITAYMDSPQDAGGTAYGTALVRGLEEAKLAAEKGHRVGLFILGDGADERVKDGGNIDDALLNTVKQEFPKDGVLAFMYVDPKNGDRIYSSLNSSLGPRFKALPPEASQNRQVLREIMQHLGR